MIRWAFNSPVTVTDNGSFRFIVSAFDLLSAVGMRRKLQDIYNKKLASLHLSYYVVVSRIRSILYSRDPNNVNPVKC